MLVEVLRFHHLYAFQTLLQLLTRAISSSIASILTKILGRLVWGKGAPRWPNRTGATWGGLKVGDQL
jgi:hypothetical protein